MDIKFPHEIEKLVAGLPYREDAIGKSGSCVLLFDGMVLKIERYSELVEKQNTMLRWLEGKLPVPKLIHSEIADGMSYILMSQIYGKMSCDEEYMKQPELTVAALAEGLKMLWTVDITDCPIVNTFDDMLADAEKHLQNIDRTKWHGSYTTPEKQFEWLKEHKPAEDFVFSHGDYCMPNVMLENGNISGFIDLAQCGAADRWYDISLCLQSLKRNFSGFFDGRSYEGYKPEMLFKKLEIELDEEKIRFHLLLDELLV